MLSFKERPVGVVPVITLVFDGLFTGLSKKFKCEYCNGTVFTYFDKLVSQFEGDIVNNPEKQFYKEYTPLDEVECTHASQNEYGKWDRCKTFYIKCRPKLEM